MPEKILKGFLIFAGVFEIILGFLFIFIHLIIENIGITITIPLFNQLGGVETILLGILLCYSARDIKRYRHIIFASIALRFIMFFFDFYAAITIPVMFGILLFASLYDLLSALITLLLLWKNNYLFLKKE
ncbi:MAG: hypothetical protein GF329_16815 [Candidatus Lokiarchaeota archaeon]|nr:hypothetical protein [Candidatus Lokiarchaeota archaeon]